MRRLLMVAGLTLGLASVGRGPLPALALSAPSRLPAAPLVQATLPVSTQLNVSATAGTQRALQLVTQDQLKAALPTESDLPGYTPAIDSTLQFPGPSGQEEVQGVLRAFASSTGSAVAFELMAVPSGSEGEFSPSAAAESILRTAAATSGARTADFVLAGSLGVGESDQAATWYSYNAAADRWLAASGEVFVRGHVLAAVLYLGLPSAWDPRALSTDAQLQDNRIVAAGLP